MLDICKLCHETVEIRESHIIPELCHKGLYDEKHRALKLRAGDLDKPPWIQKGIRDRLLCDVCEGRLNRIETSFDKFWYHSPALPPRVPAQGISIQGFDYVTFKLLHLSVLWRASVSRLKEFGAVSLGPYEEKLRRMILDLDPGPPTHFPIVGQVLVDPEDNYRVVHSLVAMPHRSRLDDAHAYLTCYAGVEWVCFMTDHPTRMLRDLGEALPQRCGKMLLRARDYRRSNTVEAIITAHRRRASGKHPPSQPMGK